MQLQTDTTPSLDVARVAPKLWIGSAPPVGRSLSRAGFDAVVLCAKEYQPPSRELPGVFVVHAGFDDSLQPSAEDVETALEASRLVATLVADKQRTLVSCWLGKNRSGLVTALALHRLYGASGRECIAAVRSARPGALFNPAFVALVEDL
jgi:protein-tyrosine phosphatase